MLPVLLGVSLIVFLIGHLSPGDPVLLLFGEDVGADPELVESLRRQLGLDQPLYIQFFNFLSGLVQGDLGRSFRTQEMVTHEIMSRLPATIELAVSALIIAVIFGIFTGIISAAYRNTVADYTITMGSLFGISMPSFWFALIAMYFLAVRIPIFPVSGRHMSMVGAFFLIFQGNTQDLSRAFLHLVLPAVTLGLPSVALIARLTRSSMLEILSQDYIRTARAKGLHERVILYRHALRNALIPVVTITGLQFGFLLGGAVITEMVFAWPGIGRLVVHAIQQRDFPIVQGVVLLTALIFVLINLFVDLTYVALDPKVRYQ